MNYFNLYNVPSYGNGKAIIARAKKAGEMMRNYFRNIKKRPTEEEIQTYRQMVDPFATIPTGKEASYYLNHSIYPITNFASVPNEIGLEKVVANLTSPNYRLGDYPGTNLQYRNYDDLMRDLFGVTPYSKSANSIRPSDNTTPAVMEEMAHLYDTHPGKRFTYYSNMSPTEYMEQVYAPANLDAMTNLKNLDNSYRASLNDAKKIILHTIFPEKKYTPTSPEMNTEIDAIMNALRLDIFNQLSTFKGIRDWAPNTLAAGDNSQIFSAQDIRNATVSDLGKYFKHGLARMTNEDLINRFFNIVKTSPYSLQMNRPKSASDTERLASTLRYYLGYVPAVAGAAVVGGAALQNDGVTGMSPETSYFYYPEE